MALHFQEEAELKLWEEANFPKLKIDDVRLFSNTGLNPEGRKVFLCPFCRKPYKTTVGLTKHVLQKHEEMIILSCRICSKIFTTVDELKKHEKKHILHLDPWQCKICLEGFSPLQPEVFESHRVTCRSKNSSIVAKIDYYSQRTGLFLWVLIASAVDSSIERMLVHKLWSNEKLSEVRF